MTPNNALQRTARELAPAFDVLTGPSLSLGALGVTPRTVKTTRQSRFGRRGFALMELPLVICLFLAGAGIITGAILSYRSGTVTVGAWAGFSFALPLFALLAFVFFAEWRNRKRSK